MQRLYLNAARKEGFCAAVSARALNHPAADFRILGPKRDQAPVQVGCLPQTAVGIGAYRQHWLRRRDVVARRIGRGFRQVKERLQLLRGGP